MVKSKRIYFLALFLSFLFFFVNDFRLDKFIPFDTHDEFTLDGPSPTLLPDVGGWRSDANTQLIRVVRVVDGDTVKINTGEVVRLIGIDAPESVSPSRPVACFGKESGEYVKNLLEGSLVRLESDVSEKDKYGRLLRYIWKDDLLVNEFLVREGYATVSTYPPDVKYQERFLEAQKEAREKDKGLWSVCSTDTESKQLEPAKDKWGYFVSETYVCDCSKTCSQMKSCEEARYQLDICNCLVRDADGDGIACDSMCQ